MPAVRIGIDVGGTFTKAVAIDEATHDIVYKASRHTTHDAPEGVARGVVQVFRDCLDGGGIQPDDVTFLAHSTTQATNAFLEGDVAQVGVLGMGEGWFQSLLAKRQTRIDPVALAHGKTIKTCNLYLDAKGLQEEPVRKALTALKHQGAQVVVASKAFGVDAGQEESLVSRIAGEIGLPATAAHEVSQMYGLTIRTRTAVVNASILPKMMEVARMTEDSVRSAGVTAPLMIMRGDGGVMSADEMKRRPVLTMLSGPSASVAAALMYLRISNGIFFEVGGTSTNITVIRNGKPTVKYAEVGGHRTYINSLDVRVLGVGGGSMVRVKDGRVVGVGPRSAHIAGLSYSAFQQSSDMTDPTVEFVQPKSGDPEDYVAVKLAAGRRVAITNTCAANVLGLTRPEWHAHGNPEAARAAMKPLADLLGVTVEEAARQILAKSAEQTVAMVERLIQEYELDRESLVLVGGGGGASSLLPFTAETMGLEFRIPENAEVIACIGVALAMVQDTVERIIPNPTPDDLISIRREAREKAIATGANPDSVQVYVEVDAVSQRVRAVALGSTELVASDLTGQITDDEARVLAASSLKLPHDDVSLAAGTDGLYIFTAIRPARGMLGGQTHPLRIIDTKGFIKVQAGDGIVTSANVGTALDEIKRLWEAALSFSGDSVVPPDIYLLNGAHLLDLSGMMNAEHVCSVAASELVGLPTDHPIVLVAVRKG